MAYFWILFCCDGSFQPSDLPHVFESPLIQIIINPLLKNTHRVPKFRLWAFSYLKLGIHSPNTNEFPSWSPTVFLTPHMTETTTRFYCLKAAKNNVMVIGTSSSCTSPDTVIPGVRTPGRLVLTCPWPPTGFAPLTHPNPLPSPLQQSLLVWGFVWFFSS